MIVRGPNQHLEPPRRRFGEIVRAEVLAQALGLDPLENGEEEDVAQVHLTSSRAYHKKLTIFPDFGDAMSLRILFTFDSRCFRRIY